MHVYDNILFPLATNDVAVLSLNLQYKLLNFIKFNVK